MFVGVCKSKGEGTSYGRGGGCGERGLGSGSDEVGKRRHEGFLYEAKGTIFVCVVGGDRGFGGLIPHLRIGVIGVGGSLVMRGVSAICRCPRGWCWVEKVGALGVTGYDGDLVGMIEGKMGVDEDEEVGDGSGKREGIREEGPGVGVRIQNDCQEGWWRFLG